MSVLRVQAIFQGRSGLPRDIFESIFHFITPTELDVGATPGEAWTAAARVANFYTGAAAGGGSGISHFLSGWIAPPALLKVYDISPLSAGVGVIPDSGPPLFECSYVSGIDTSGIGIPPEVALVLSYITEKNKPRFRGRVYVGPFNMAALGPVNNTPNPDLMLAMQTAGSRLVEAGTSAQSTAGLTPIVPGTPIGSAVDGVNWILFSRLGTGTKVTPAPTYNLVTAGWVDNEWDGQSRRRVLATARSTFPS